MVRSFQGGVYRCHIGSNLYADTRPRNETFHLLLPGTLRHSIVQDAVVVLGVPRAMPLEQDKVVADEMNQPYNSGFDKHHCRDKGRLWKSSWEFTMNNTSSGTGSCKALVAPS
jgi:hypothetical protein